MIQAATWFLYALGAYAAIGLVFGLFFVWRGARQIDPAARGGTLGFRLMILPGASALWPILARRWWRGESAPPEERGAHREAAGR